LVFGGASEKGSFVGIFSLVQSDAKTDSSWVVSSCLTSSIEDCIVVFMVLLIDESMQATVALSCFTSFWVSRKPDCKVLKQVSISWLWVWAIRMGELKRGGMLGMCYILCMCVCVGASDTMTASDDPFT
jgi:hypothetical protein